MNYKQVQVLDISIKTVQVPYDKDYYEMLLLMSYEDSLRLTDTGEYGLPFCEPIENSRELCPIHTITRTKIYEDLEKPPHLHRIEEENWYYTYSTATKQALEHVFIIDKDLKASLEYDKSRLKKSLEIEQNNHKKLYERVKNASFMSRLKYLFTKSL